MVSAIESCNTERNPESSGGIPQQQGQGEVLATTGYPAQKGFWHNWGRLNGRDGHSTGPWGLEGQYFGEKREMGISERRCTDGHKIGSCEDQGGDQPDEIGGALRGDREIQLDGESQLPRTF